MLLEFAIADAYGAGHEFRSEELIKSRNDGVTYHRHGGDPAHRPGMPTDDTQMMTAVASVLLHENVDNVDDETAKYRFAAKFYELRDHLAPGYSRRMRQRYAECDSVEQFMAAGRALPLFAEPPEEYDKHAQPKPFKSLSVGAAMRELPIGFLPTNHIHEMCELQGSVTHGDRPHACGDVARYVGAALRNHAIYIPSELFHGRSPIFEGIMIGHRHVGSIEELLYKACEMGGDTDTRAAVAAGCYCARTSYSIVRDLGENHPLVVKFAGQRTLLETLEIGLRKKYDL